MWLVPTFIAPAFLLFYILVSSLQHAGSFIRLVIPDTPLLPSVQDMGWIRWACLLSLLGNSSTLCFRNTLQKGISYYCLLPCTGKHSKLFILLIHKREDSTLLIISSLFCLGAMSLNILGWSKIHQTYSPTCQCDVHLCDTELSLWNIEWKPAMLHTDIQQSSHSINNDHSYTLLLKN